MLTLAEAATRALKSITRGRQADIKTVGGFSPTSEGGNARKSLRGTELNNSKHMFCFSLFQPRHIIEETGEWG